MHGESDLLNNGSRRDSLFRAGLMRKQSSGSRRCSRASPPGKKCRSSTLARDSSLRRESPRPQGCEERGGGELHGGNGPGSDFACRGGITWGLSACTNITGSDSLRASLRGGGSGGLLLLLVCQSCDPPSSPNISRIWHPTLVRARRPRRPNWRWEARLACHDSCEIATKSRQHRLRANTTRRGTTWPHQCAGRHVALCSQQRGQAGLGWRRLFQRRLFQRRPADLARAPERGEEHRIIGQEPGIDDAVGADKGQHGLRDSSCCSSGVRLREAGRRESAHRQGEAHEAVSRGSLRDGSSAAGIHAMRGGPWPLRRHKMCGLPGREKPTKTGD
mmetsp:Transcript_111189/g.358734  ORF Transcript_111189/g.358734 Transcript_111189/m.358734 type:complete len:332 (-) Transcript_111189:18-1013(-)